MILVVIDMVDRRIHGSSTNILLMEAIHLTHPPEQEQLIYISKTLKSYSSVSGRHSLSTVYKNSFLEDNVSSLIQLRMTKSPEKGTSSRIFNRNDTSKASKTREGGS